MAQNTKARGKIVRRLGTNVYGHRKYDRLLRKKPQGPGMGRGERSRKKVSEYGRQLIEKQKLRYGYGLSEKQFYNTFQRAKKRKQGLTGNNFLILLESRLDSVIYRLAWGSSRAQARQIVSHGHIYVNGRRVNIPSVTLRAGDKVAVKDSDVSRKLVREAMAHNSASVPAWLELKADELVCEMKREATREEIPSIANEQMIVEYYSR